MLTAWSITHTSCLVSNTFSIVCIVLYLDIYIGLLAVHTNEYRQYCQTVLSYYCIPTLTHDSRVYIIFNACIPSRFGCNSVSRCQVCLHSCRRTKCML